MNFLKSSIPLNQDLLKGLISFFVLASMQTALAFESPALIGKVFHDHNGNGYLDNQEQGIPGVRLFTIEGLMIETDAYGRFHILESHHKSSTYLTNRSSVVLKVDQASLPENSRLTTENPRVLRLSNVIINKVNFGIHF